MHTEDMKETKPDSTRTISIKLPRLSLPSLQASILILLIGVGVFQTVQLYGLNLQITSGKVGVDSGQAVSSPTDSTDSVTSSLPNMVGGC